MLDVMPLTLAVTTFKQKITFKNEASTCVELIWNEFLKISV